MTSEEAISYLASLRVTALSQRNQRAANAMDIALKALDRAYCACGHEAAQHLCVVKICGCMSFTPVVSESRPNIEDELITEAVDSFASGSMTRIDGSAANSDSAGSEPPSAWLPIESAPKDGTWFLAWDSDSGQYTYRMGPGFITGEDPQPTHWMPLPLPPSSKE